ncbi:type IV secretory system conjugative DNA transfer family protein [Bradyrhizobium yuanmingense]|uniref:type IV secretory system conjugative DNA transfer family protein n=1 Tax=Bradyrhizobium yuanmingense TaxID=108015 RepID=UPI0023B9094F|nr:type IV secretory system conjugative DNA transfer family protein [Bradyrhizobium yuanmingense]MDF0522834.1 type IV secretory system conjugative DNA transfer family protein [Bradyrhizobium yuanmingense]
MVREDEVRKATGSPFYLGLGGLPEAHKSLADDPAKYDIATALKVGLRVRGRSQGNRTALMSQSAQLSQPTRRQLLMPDEAIRLPRSIIVTILKGHPSRLKQAPYFTRTEFNHLYRLLPGENFPERDQQL